ncbi:conserved hypothetical protein [Candidatus Nitrotoga sp. HW29]|uniref:class I SAM-dependent methyltransferase n=1 Tax=Candidatus Nitrotoga sp. HW29 TaxID=2886963 RepID=UPI001EF2A13E|nr:class I SAM-dependent methyltransferase [Candidatus Nitrotoga sp. HW29]CAH1906339.1 conserved hypothetical protein [Candidatus Nitrotoga sp. HW29]
MIQLIERTTDVVTGSPNLEDLHTLSAFPIFMGTTDQARSNDLTADMSWSISRDSGLIQLKHLLPLDLLYQAQTTTSAVGPTWMAHHRAFAEFLRAYSPRSVLELGGAHGILSVEYHQRVGQIQIPWTILEPNPAPVEGCRARFLKGFFDEECRLDEDYDVLVHSHVFEHLYEPAQFMARLCQFMAPGQIMVFSVPDLYEWLKRKFTNCINFEHTVFLTEPYVDELLARYGFRTLEKRHVMDGHSIFYAAMRDDAIESSGLSHDLYAQNRRLYEEFVEYYQTLTHEINAKVDAWEGEVFLFGAHVFAQYLIAFGLDTRRIRCILDNDSRKQGRRLYGTDLIVATPEILAGLENAAVILKAGIYNEEIRNGIRARINDSIEYFE